MTMSIYQPVQRSYQRKVSNVKHESYCSSHKQNIWYPLKADVREYLKTVEVSCMNRLFQGVGFRNDNGGLEFYSEDYKEKHCSTVGEYITMLRKEQQALEEEYKNVEFEIARGNICIEDWQSQYEDLQSQLQSNNDSMQHLIMQGKTGQIAEADKLRMRQQLKTEKKRLVSQMESLKAEIDGYHNSKNRLSMLKCILPELQDKISNKEKELEVASTFTIEQPGLLTFPWVKGIVAKQVNLFADMFDYMAYVFLSSNPDAEKLPTLCDNIVMNDPRNFTTMLLNSVSYDRIYCFFPHTLLGITMEKTVLQKINSGRAMSLSDYYGDYTTLYEYAKTFDDFVPISSKL